MDVTTIYRFALGGDRQPDAWRFPLASDARPRVLIAPTGSDKPAAGILGWGAHRLPDPQATPRRLIWCLPMRTLVEQTANAVRDWFGKLATEVDVEGRLPKPEDVYMLMGGVEAAGWVEAPERQAVLVGTHDLLLTRAVMRPVCKSARVRYRTARFRTAANSLCLKSGEA